MHIICVESYGSPLAVGGVASFEVCRRSRNGVHPAQSARRRHGRVEQGHPRRAGRADDAPHRRERLRHAADHARDVRPEDRAVRPGRLAVRVVDEGYRRLHQCGGLVDGTDRVPKGCALHDAVRSRRSRLLLRTAGRALFPADRFAPLLVATRHRPTATLAPPGAADQGQQQDSVRRVALRPPPRVALDRAGVRRQRANTRSAQRDRRAAAVADHRDPGGPGGARLARQGDLSGDSR